MLRRLIAVVVLSLAQLGAGCAGGRPPAIPVVPDLDVHPRTEPLPLLRVAGNRIVDPAGAPVVFHGVNLGDLIPLHRRGLLEESYVREAAAWGADLVRIPIAPQDFRSAGADETFRLLDQAVDWAEMYGMYVIVDWHSIGNPLTGTFQPPADAFRTTPDELREFWRAVARRYKDRPAVAFYEIFNEPAALPWIRPGDELRWEDWRALMDEIVGVIQAENPRAIPIVAGLAYATDLGGLSAEPLRSEGIALAAHVYPGQIAGRGGTLAQICQARFGFAAARYPILLTEIGFDPDDRMMPSVYRGDVEFGAAVVAYAEELGASWTAYTFYLDPYYPMPLFRDWASFRPTVSGAFFKQRMIEHRR